MKQHTHVGGELEQYLLQAIRDVPDFPKPGIVFKDITPILSDPIAFRQVTKFFLERYQRKTIDSIVAIESRGFLFAAPLAHQLGIPLHLARKKGKLPYSTIEESYSLEYGTAAIEMHTDAVKDKHRVLIIDDLLATGGTASATAKLVERLGGTVTECAFVIELAFLPGRKQLADYDVCSVVRYE